jgi:hypothetical protein
MRSSELSFAYSCTAGVSRSIAGKEESLMVISGAYELTSISFLSKRVCISICFHLFLLVGVSVPCSFDGKRLLYGV